eukprot:11190015-Alexandrium_andersonii.AAC.1
MCIRDRGRRTLFRAGPPGILETALARASTNERLRHICPPRKSELDREGYDPRAPWARLARAAC